VTPDDQALALAAAFGSGLLVGIERGWTLRLHGEGTRVAGIRTFALLGLLAGIAGLVGGNGYPLAAGTIVGAASAVLAIGYWAGVRRSRRVDATSTIAGLVTLALGLLAGSGHPTLAIAAAALVTLALALRAEAHGLIRQLDEADVKALARFAVIAAAILPFLPTGSFGPYDAWNPRQLWLVVVVVIGFSFAGYVANRLFGARSGTIATAIIGGAYSSTAATQSLAQRLGSPDASGAEPAGIALASAVMYLRVLLLVGVLATSALRPFALVIGPAATVAWIAGVLLWRRAPAGQGPAPPGNPIALGPALLFVLFIAAAAVGTRWAEGRFGEQGMAALVVIVGSLDVDAAIITVGGLPGGALEPMLAALALGAAILVNMLVKLGITLVLARGRAREASLALGASMIVLASTLAALWVGL
jgi:uncharacterized membrane protein (DUF4010 family)